jgi:anti-sigma B factor antagonist
LPTGKERFSMRSHEPVAGTAVVKLPTEVDISNADHVGEQLRAAAAPGVMVVVADLTTTKFCDSAGVRQLALTYDKVADSGAQLRLAVTEGGSVDRILALIGLEQLVPQYPTVEAALAAPPERAP